MNSNVRAGSSPASSTVEPTTFVVGFVFFKKILKVCLKNRGFASKIGQWGIRFYSQEYFFILEIFFVFKIFALRLDENKNQEIKDFAFRKLSIATK